MDIGVDIIMDIGVDIIIIYQITCKECGDVYTGETSRNGHSRSIEHVNDAESNNEEEKERSVSYAYTYERKT